MRSSTTDNKLWKLNSADCKETKAVLRCFCEGRWWTWKMFVWVTQIRNLKTRVFLQTDHKARDLWQSRCFPKTGPDLWPQNFVTMWEGECLNRKILGQQENHHCQFLTCPKIWGLVPNVPIVGIGHQPVPRKGDRLDIDQFHKAVQKYWDCCIYEWSPSSDVVV